LQSDLTVKQLIEIAKHFPQSATAYVVGLVPRSFRDTDAPRNEDGTYDLAAVYRWGTERATDDPLLTGGDSPNLERYRKAKAELAEMDAAERRGQMADIGSLCEWFLTDVAPHFRRAVEEIDRINPDAAKIMDRAIERVCEAVEQRKPASPDGGQDPADPENQVTVVAQANEAASDPDLG
jgi:hypothetical protein